MSRRLPLGVRTRLLLAVAGAVAVALAIGVTAFDVLLEQRLSDSATALARAEAEAEVASLRVVNGRLTAPERPVGRRLGNTVWVFAGTTALESPRTSPAVQALARSLAVGSRSSLEGERTRFYALPVVDSGRRVGTVVAAVSLSAYEETARTALLGSLVLALALLGVVVLLTNRILARALRPVSQMTRDAAAWSDSDLERRFRLGEPHDEITRLGATLDGLLERVAASLRHEQRFTAELSHELRTPLARISAQAELALARDRAPDEYRDSFASVQRSAEQMTRIVEALVAAARTEAGLEGGRSDAREAVTRAAESAVGATPGERIRLELPAEPARVAVEVDLLERMLTPLLDNALRYSAGPVAVTVAARNGIVVVAVADEGPGIEPGEEERIFAPGVRGAAAEAGTGAGLGLALAARLARSAGGRIEVEERSDGATFVLVLPSA